MKFKIIHIFFIMIIITIIITTIITIFFIKKSHSVEYYIGNKDFSYAQQTVKSDEYLLFEENGQTYLFHRLCILGTPDIKINSIKITPLYSEDNFLTIDLDIDIDPEKLHTFGCFIGYACEDIIIKVKPNISGVGISSNIFANKKLSKFSGSTIGNINSKIGYVDSLGNLILPEEYDYIKKYDFGLTVLEKDNLYAICDSSFKKLTDFEFDSFSILSNLDCDYPYAPVEAQKSTKQYYVKVEKNGKFGIFNKFGKFIIPIKYDSIDTINFSYYEDSYFKVSDKESNLFGLYDCNGKIIIPLKYENITNCETVFHNDIDPIEEKILPKFRIYNDSLVGIADNKGNVLLEPLYDYAYAIYIPNTDNTNHFIVEKDKKTAVIDSKNNILLDYSNQSNVSVVFLKYLKSLNIDY